MHVKIDEQQSLQTLQVQHQQQLQQIIIIQQGVPRGHAGPLAGTLSGGQVIRGVPTHFPHPAAEGGAKENGPV